MIPRYASSSSLPTCRRANVRPQQRRYHSSGDRGVESFELDFIDGARDGGALDAYEPTSPALKHRGSE